MTEGNKKMLRIFSGLGALFMTLVIALSFKIYYALATDQPVMKKNYYETGRRYDKYVNDRANTDNRQLKAAMFEAVRYPHMPVKGFLKLQDNKLDVMYLDQKSEPVDGALVILKLGRRSTNEQDFKASCRTDKSGKCSILYTIPARGYWEGSLSAQDPDGRFTMRGAFKL